MARVVLRTTRQASAMVPRAASVPLYDKTLEVQARFLSSAAQEKRPLSPHLTIYKPGINMVASVMFRGTGMVLSTGAFLRLQSYFVLHGLSRAIPRTESQKSASGLCLLWLGRAQV